MRHIVSFSGGVASAAEAADAVGVCTTSVWRALRREGIATRWTRQMKKEPSDD